MVSKPLVALLSSRNVNISKALGLVAKGFFAFLTVAT